MTIEATAEALAQEPVTEQAPAEAPFDIDGAMDAIWNKAQNEPDTAEDEVDSPPEDQADVEKPDEEQAEPDKPKVDAPSELPKAVRDHWALLPEAAQQAILTSQQELNRKLSEQGRQMQGIAPIRDELVNFAKELPEMANMRPEEIARELRTFRNEVLAPLSQKPLETLLRVAKERGVSDQLREALGGQQPSEQSNAFKAISDQNKQLAQQVQTLTQRLEGIEMQPVQTTVSEFASKAEHWADVEATMPNAIAYVQATFPNLSPKDVLEKAYDMEIQRLGKATPAPAEEAHVQADPERAGKALKAKSVNVSGQPSKPKPMSINQLDDQIWRKHHS